MNTKPSPMKRVSPKASVDLTEPTDVNLISLTYSNKMDKILQFLERSPEYSILPVRDVRLYTCTAYIEYNRYNIIVLHIACLNNQINICQMFFSHAKRLNATPEEIKEWVNAKTDEGFSPMHFASFKGNIELVRLLEINGADIHCRNHQGLSVIHIAAQGDQPVSIAYFQKKGLSIHEKDKKGSTPLHWAAFLGMENATTYLTTWGCSPNVTDKETGLTPLHLAVISGNPRVVRRLLIKGADKTLKNTEGKTPIQLARDNEYENIVQILQDKNKLLTYLNIKPNLQKNRTRFSLMMFIIMYIVAVGGNIFLIFPYLEHLVWVVLFGLVTGVTLLSFLLVWLSNPGYIKNHNKGDILHLLLNNDPHLVCPECIIVKPLRSKHCEYCNSCVAVYDHHCPWINNCVGARNHAYFITFTISTLIAIVYLCIMGAAHITSDIDSYDYFPFFKYSDHHLVHTLKYVICGIDIIAALVFVIPLFALNYVQVGNFFVGKTTSERFGFNVSRDNLNQTMNQSISSSRIENGYTKITKEPGYQFMQAIANCKLMCCSNKEDKRYNLKLIEASNISSSNNIDNSGLMSP